MLVGLEGLDGGGGFKLSRGWAGDASTSRALGFCLVARLVRVGACVAGGFVVGGLVFVVLVVGGFFVTAGGLAFFVTVFLSIFVSTVEVAPFDLVRFSDAGFDSGGSVVLVPCDTANSTNSCQSSSKPF